ncbi:sushi, von Willebrand factor type A, EGF and pentraxin domain-containing protein 1-like isoform X1 [Melanotaenia boesemani]|uniref:sushi, von Willebrand factor type A, EGF and pentraxin domain-containing protein 1-like isoform X1 n=1 Tax=Melanotaenia boesemani TaxID=1250792 RepID=UPI001C03A8F2|nr:sushi, von Willebrand factor type A, EGF and pentraxin domain-containing protein 1-like isoform X1 [Melanotaenia boesemani]
MRTLGAIFLVLSFTLLTSAQFARKCSSPLEYPTTTLDKTIISKQSFNSGDRVFYRCAEDFTPSAGKSAVVCQDGTWSKLTLKCDKRTCGNAGDIPNGHFIYDGETYIGEKVFAKCNQGYVVKGMGFMTCERTGWSGEFPSCVEGVVETTCSTPSVDNSLQKGGDDAVHRVGDSLSFTCRQGFQLDGAQQITCGPDGQWQPRSPLCLPAPIKTVEPPLRKGGGCGTPETIVGSNVNLVDKYAAMTAFSSGDKVYYTCDLGYVAAGGYKGRRCVDGKWTKLTLKCEQGVSVPSVVKITCPTPSVDNSLQKGGDVAVHQVGESLRFTCRQGFHLVGPQQITCGPEGQWQPPSPRCLPVPIKTVEPPLRKEGGCGAPETIEGKSSNVNLVDKYAAMTAFSSDDKVYYTCDVGYIAAGGSRIRRCIGGKWTKLTLKCERKLCGHAGEIQNGQFVYTGIEFGDTATAKCNEGFNMIGKATRNCMALGWDGRAPVCEAVVCPEPNVSNAVRKDVQEPPYRYKTAIRYKCGAGTLVGPNEIWCTKDGTWSSSPPVCRELGCLSPNVNHAYWMGAHKKMHEPMETISIECFRGYTIRGPNPIYCSREGTWLPELPKCMPYEYNTWRRG